MMTLTLPGKREYTFTLHPADGLVLSEEEFAELCERNPEYRIEQDATGEVIIMPPTGGETGSRNFRITAQLAAWAFLDGTGEGFDSSTGFVLPSGAKRSPDVSWVASDRLAALTAEQKRQFIPLCPDFVVELRSSSDSLADLQAKMEEYRANGARLGWLLDPTERHVYVYRPDAPVETLEHPAAVSGDPELPGFTLQLARIWEPGF